MDYRSSFQPPPSATVKESEIEAQEREEEEEEDNYYSGCCCGKERRTDRRLLDFIVKNIVGVSILVYSLVELSTAEECDSLISFWCGLVSLVVGVFVGNSSGGSGSRRRSGSSTGGGTKQ